MRAPLSPTKWKAQTIFLGLGRGDNENLNACDTEHERRPSR